jgi:hypothetical protein
MPRSFILILWAWRARAMKTILNKPILRILAGVVSALLLPCFALADSSVITNSVNVSSNTGGGGSASAVVNIHTVENGVTVEDIHESTSSSSGSVEIHRSYQSTEGNVKSSVNVQVGGMDNLESARASLRTNSDATTSSTTLVSDAGASTTVGVESPVSAINFLSNAWEQFINYVFNLFGTNH